MKYKKLNRYTDVFDVYLAPSFMLAIAIVFTVLSFTASVPEAAQLSEVRGHLQSYYHKQTGRGRSDYTTIVILEDGKSFWTDAVNKDTAAKLFSRQGIEVRFYVEPNSGYDPIDSAIKSYGLWVNDQQVEALNSSLEHEKLIVHVAFSALAVFFAAFAVFIYRRSKARAETQHK